MSTEKMYRIAKEIYADIGVDTEAAMKRVSQIPVSIQCWQGDDVRGFENPDGDLTGGIQTTGNYPGRARNLAELRADFEYAARLIPGKKKISLHAIYLDNQGKNVARDEIEPCHFQSWIDWAKERHYGIDFNPTFFSHPLSADGFTLSHVNRDISDYWIRHGIASRLIAEEIGRQLGETVCTNHWVPDGFKDMPVDRMAARERLADSFDQIFAKPIDKKYNLDGVESKVFGIGAESCTIGSHEFYMGCALKHGVMLTLDAGHYHPTEVISDKISSSLLYMKDILLHVSRPVRWDSDHVVIFDDELKAIAAEILRNNAEERVHIGLDYFDASINRVSAWVIGTRNMQKALLYAALEPTATLKKMEACGDFTSRLAYLEELKSYPFTAVWDYYCENSGVPVRDQWIEDVQDYEKNVLSKR